MSPPVRSEDPENPKASLPRCRFLDYCLVISLVLLTMVVGSLCTLYVAWERPQFESIVSAQIQMNQERRNTQLVVDNVQLINTTLEWSRSGVTSTFVNQDFELDKQELVVKRTGYYFVFSQITLKCVDSNQCQEEASVSLSVLKNIEKEPILKVNVSIDKSTMVNMMPQPSSFSGSIRLLKSGDRIRAQLWTSQTINDWQFDTEYSVLGLSWISDTVPVAFQEQ
ncbi:tumor necrosis factor ligand superfamily member 9-like [Bufo bufo]|uniref:tumor necrosis factor ligand superfamily member 9-like n=1 Tax=Bufo bufo TaxID=8384 RepID=UPI001ABE7553|nr:tumor necrosis factor ligand superfamily member 9-like [Bufo bufo]